MALAAEATKGPPDVRGGTAPLPASVFVAGIVALSASIGGTLLVQIAYALGGSSDVSQKCIAEGVRPDLIGALGVCHVIEAFRSRPQTIVLLIGLVVGLGAVVAGFGVYKRMPTKRMREQAIAGAVLGTQAVLVSLLLFYFRSGTIFNFVN